MIRPIQQRAPLIAGSGARWEQYSEGAEGQKLNFHEYGREAPWKVTEMSLRVREAD